MCISQIDGILEMIEYIDRKISTGIGKLFSSATQIKVVNVAKIEKRLPNSPKN